MSVDKNEELPDLPDLAELRPEKKAPASLPELPDDALTVATAPKAPAPKPAARPAPKPPVRPPAKLEVEPPAPPAPAEVPAPAKTKPAPPVAPPAKAAPVVAAASPKEAPLEEVPSVAAPESAQAAASKPLAPGEKPPLRELDKAPIHLRLAAQIVTVAALLPFMGAGDGWAFSLGGKLVAILGAVLWFKQVDHNWGPPLKGALGRLAALNFAKKKAAEAKPKRKSVRDEGTTQKLEHPFPTALHLVSVLVVLGGLVLALKDGRTNILGPTGITETLMVTWAAFTFVHIHAYERWGGFNPLFPLMFLGMLFAGAARALTILGEGLHVPSVLGGLGVAVGGGLAAYTIVEAMMSAKKEGDIKKAAALEARKVARKSRK